jgi:hypothetical protein
MYAYIISYDLNKKDKDYEGVYDAIKKASNGVWCHYLDSTWIIKSSYPNANDISNLINKHLDSNDRCFVCELKENYSGWLTEEQWKYIRENIF